MNRDQVLEVVAHEMPPVRLQRVSDPSRSRVLIGEEGFAIRHGSGRSQPLAAEAVQGLLDMIGLPKRVAERLQTRTLQTTATELLSGAPPFSVLMREGQVTDLVKADRPVLPAERALKEAERAVRGLEFHRVTVLENHVVRVECVGTREQLVVRGDLIKSGALIQFSPIGTVEPLVQSYGLRLQCTNGQVSEEILQTFRRQRGGGEGDEVWQWYRESVRAACGSLGQIVDRMQALRETRIPANSRAMTLEGMLHQAGIQGAMAEAVRAYALEHPPQNEYDLLNILTHFTSHVIENPAAMVKAQRAGGQYLSESEHRRRCPTCRR